MRKILLIIGLICFIIIDLKAQDSLSADKQKNIRLLLELTDVLKIGREIGRSIIHERLLSIELTDKEIPDSIYYDLKEDVIDFFDEAMVTENGLVDDLIKIYHKYYSADEIKELITFYKTETGKKTVTIMPLLFRESSTAIKNWCENLVPYMEAMFKEKLKFLQTKKRKI